MLVLYDERGIITSCIIQHAETLEVLSERYADQGIPHVMHDGPGDIVNSYVKDGAVIDKPAITITGEIRSVKANGVDALTFTIDPPSFTIAVLLQNSMVHQENVTDGMFEFVTDHSGSYYVAITAAHPYKPSYMQIEAI